MGHDNNGRAAAHHLLDAGFALLLEMEVSHRKDLVHDEDIRMRDGGNGKGHARHHARGIVFHGNIQKILHFGKFHDLIELFMHHFAREAEHRAVQEDVFPRGEVHIEACAELDEGRDGAVYLHRSLRRLEDAGNHLEKGALARPVEADDPKNVSLPDIEGNVVERHEVFIHQLALQKLDDVFLDAVYLLFAHIEMHLDIADFHCVFHDNHLNSNIKNKLILRLFEDEQAEPQGGEAHQDAGEVRFERGDAPEHDHLPEKIHEIIKRVAPHDGEDGEVPALLDDRIVVQDRRDIHQRGQEYAVKMDDIPEEHGNGAEDHPHAHRKDKYIKNGDGEEQDGPVQGIPLDEEHNGHRDEGKAHVHKGKQRFFQRENVFRDIHLFN